MRQGRLYNVVLQSLQGPFICNRNDLGVGWQLAERGAYDPDEVTLLCELARAAADTRGFAYILDAGANIGVHSTQLAEAVAPHGKVFAFEPQRIVFQTLVGNVALRSLENVYCFNQALGSTPGRIAVPRFDYSKKASFGSIEFGSSQREPIGQLRNSDSALPEESVELVTVDSLNLPALDVMKLDVEGMEVDVLIGADATIRTYHPAILVEHIKANRGALVEILHGYGYRLFEQRQNWLCLTGSTPAPSASMREVTTSDY